MGEKCSKQTNQQIITEQNMGEYLICSQEEKMQPKLKRHGRNHKRCLKNQ